MVDGERLLAVLGRVTARLRILDEYAAADPVTLSRDRVRLSDVKYTFQTAIEACIDAALHGWPTKGSAYRHRTAIPSGFSALPGSSVTSWP